MNARNRYVLWLLIAGAMIGVATAAGIYWRRTPEIEPEKSFPLPGFSKSPYLNTGPNAQYVGTAACAECHSSKHQSYLHTAHSRAFSEVDANKEPPDGAFDHKPSRRSYRVHRKDGKMWHEEIVKGEDGKILSQVDLPVRYLVGSGNFSRTYVVEIDGFLYESPITWYASKQAWTMSPGYDRPDHFGFERPVMMSCMFCHSGRVAEIDGAGHRLSFPEMAIGCESCHGPGSLHSDLRRKRKLDPIDEDLTIVNPGKLPRQLQEDTCGVCHLAGQIDIHVRGRLQTDFRPGMPLREYRIHYQVAGDHEQMAVVGHIEQMRLSKCYQSSQMTCLSCHDPHLRTAPKDSVAYFRQKCMTCHDNKPCSSPPAERLKKEPADNCAACHMPRGDTDIAHIAFTHHRVGHHGKPKAPASVKGTPELVPMEDLDHLSPLDQKRNLALALIGASTKAGFEAHRGAFQARAHTLLHEVYDAGLRDAESLRVLSEYYAPIDQVRARKYATEALALAEAPSNVRGSALTSLTMFDMAKGEFPSALRNAESLGRIYRTTDTLHLLANCHLLQNEPSKALAAAQKALKTRPHHPLVQKMVGDIHRQLGNNTLADEHLRKAEALSKLGQD